MRALAMLLLLSPSLAHAEEDEIDMGHVVAVEMRPYRLVHEFRAGLGVLPVDSFQTAITISGSYTLHLTDVWAWEALGFSYAIDVDTGVEKMLASRWSIAPALDRASLQYLLGTQILCTPLYGKLALFDDSVVYGDIHFSGGGGLVHYSDGFRPQVGAGPGFRIFLGAIVSLRLDLRVAVVPNAPGGTDVMFGAELSVATTFGGSRVTEQEVEQTAHRSVDGLDLLHRLYPEKKEEEQP